MGKESINDLYWKSNRQNLSFRHTSALKLLRTKPEDGPILDCGGGDGLISHLLIEKGYEVVCIDNSKIALSRAKEHGAKVFVHDLNEILPFKDEKFATILHLSVLEHLIANPNQVLKELARVTKKDIIIGTTNWCHWMFRFQNLFGIYPRFPRPEKGDIRWISYSLTKKAILKNHLKIVKTDMCEFSPRIPKIFARIWPNLTAMNFNFLCEKKAR